MKKMTKVLLLLAFIFIVLGGIITAIGVFFGGHTAIGWDKEKHRFITADDRYYVTSEKTKLDKFYSIDIHRFVTNCCSKIISARSKWKKIICSTIRISH